MSGNKLRIQTTNLASSSNNNNINSVQDSGLKSTCLESPSSQLDMQDHELWRNSCLILRRQQELLKSSSSSSSTMEASQFLSLEALRLMQGIKSPHPLVLFNMGRLLANCECSEYSLRYFKRAIKLDQTLCIAYFEMANVKAFRSEFDHAVSLLEMCLRVFSTLTQTNVDYKDLGMSYTLYACEVRVNMAILLKIMGKEEAAKSIIQAVLSDSNALSPAVVQSADSLRKSFGLLSEEEVEEQDYELFAVPNFLYFESPQSSLQAASSFDMTQYITNLCEKEDHRLKAEFEGALHRIKGGVSPASLSTPKSPGKKSPKIGSSHKLFRKRSVGDASAVKLLNVDLQKPDPVHIENKSSESVNSKESDEKTGSTSPYSENSVKSLPESSSNRLLSPTSTIQSSSLNSSRSNNIGENRPFRAKLLSAESKGSSLKAIRSKRNSVLKTGVFNAPLTPENITFKQGLNSIRPKREKVKNVDPLPWRDGPEIHNEASLRMPDKVTARTAGLSNDLIKVMNQPQGKDNSPSSSKQEDVSLFYPESGVIKVTYSDSSREEIPFYTFKLQVTGIAELTFESISSLVLERINTHYDSRVCEAQELQLNIEFEGEVRPLEENMKGAKSFLQAGHTLNLVCKKSESPESLAPSTQTQLSEPSQNSSSTARETPESSGTVNQRSYRRRGSESTARKIDRKSRKLVQDLGF